MKIGHAMRIKRSLVVQALYFSRRMIIRQRALVEADSRRIVVRKTKRSLRIRVKGRNTSTANSLTRSIMMKTVLQLIPRSRRPGSLRLARRGSLILNSRRIRRKRRLKSLTIKPIKTSMDSLHLTLNPLNLALRL
jgi:hypothetical protein